MLPVNTGNTIKPTIIKRRSVVRKREGSISKKHSPAQLKPTSLDIGQLELTTVSCPSLLHSRDGTVGKNKGTVTRIFHTPPTSFPHLIRKPGQGDFFLKGHFLHVQDFFVGEIEMPSHRHNDLFLSI